MNAPSREAIRRAVMDSVRAVAPEADFAGIDPRKSLREQLDLDSFDYLNALIGLHKRLGVEVPETDYGKIDTLAAMIDYLAVRLGSA